MNPVQRDVCRKALTAALAACDYLAQVQPAHNEFWRRLAGTIRKGLTKL